MDKPSLHEIAAMPFPLSREAMRQHYNPDWGRETSEDGQKRKFRVRAEYSVTEYLDCTIEAFTKEEAREEAEQEIPGDAVVYSLECDEIGGEA